MVFLISSYYNIELIIKTKGCLIFNNKIFNQMRSIYLFFLVKKINWILFLIIIKSKKLLLI